MTDKTPQKEQTPEQLARRIFELLNNRDLDTLGDYQQDDVVDDFIAVGAYRGRAEVRRFFEEMFAAFPDFRLEIEHTFGDDKHAVVQWRARGTLTGAPFQGVEPNGKTIELRGVDVMVFSDGKLAHNTIYYDGAAFARGVGLLPPVGSPVEKMLFAGFNAVTAVRRTVGL
jgi:steroid delta-isomerase-like uncharacterized protein